MLSQAQIDFFHANGYVNGGLVLTDAEVETLRAETMRVIEERERTDIPQPVLVRNLGRASNAMVMVANDGVVIVRPYGPTAAALPATSYASMISV